MSHTIPIPQGKRHVIQRERFTYNLDPFVVERLMELVDGREFMNKSDAVEKAILEFLNNRDDDPTSDEPSETAAV